MSVNNRREQIVNYVTTEYLPKRFVSLPIIMTTTVLFKLVTNYGVPNYK